MKFLRGLTGKILVPVVIMTLLLVIATLAVSSMAFRKAVKESFEREITMAARDIVHELKIMGDLLMTQLDEIALDPTLIHAIQANDREVLLKAIEEYDMPRKADFFTVFDSQQNALLRTHNLEVFGDSAKGRPDVKDAFDGKPLRTFFESTVNVPLALRGTTAIRDQDGKIIGAIAGGYRLDTNDWVDGMKEFFDLDFTTFVGEMRVATTLKKADGERAVGTPLNNPSLKKILFEDKENMFGETLVLGKMMKVFYHPLLGPDGNTVGIVFSGIPMAKLENAIWSNVYNNLAITGVGLFVFCSLLFWVVRSILGHCKKSRNRQTSWCKAT